MGRLSQFCFRPKTKSPPSSPVSQEMAQGGSAAGEIPDLEETVTAWAKYLFDVTKDKDQSKIKSDFLQFNINWKNVKFQFDEPNYDMVPFANNKGPQQNVQPQVLFRTNFCNSTNREQEYSFKTERVTRSCATIIVETGFSRGFDFGLQLKTPGEIVEANAGFSRSMSVTNIGEDTIEEELTWGVDSQVKVPANTETTAELVITEAQCQGSFRMRTRITGRVLVTVTNLKENNSLVTLLEGQMHDIIARAKQKQGSRFRNFNVEGHTVTVQTLGKCNFKFGVEQRVKITEEPIKREF